MNEFGGLPFAVVEITNMSLAQIAEKQFGMTVERRQIPVEELSIFEEAGACGTAAVISPIDKIVDINAVDRKSVV